MRSNLSRLGMVVGALALAGCTQGQQGALNMGLASPPGQLFCTIQTTGGGSFVARLLATAMTGTAPTAAPLFVLATDAGKAAVDADCAKAAQTVTGGVSGVPVSPPANPGTVASVAIPAPASPVVSGKPAT